MNKLSRPVHISWHIALAASGVIIGVALVLILPVDLWRHNAWSVVAGCLLVSAIITRKGWALIVAFVAGLIAGLWIGAIKQYDLSAYSIMYGREVTVQGTVADDVSYSVSGEQRVQLRGVMIGERTYDGRLWISSKTQAEIKRGDQVTFTGTLEEGFGNIPATMFRATLDVVRRPEPGDVARKVRDWFAEAIRVGLVEPHASLGIGYLIGQRTAVSNDISNQFQVLGLVHLVVASGYHVTVAVRFLRRALGRISKFTAAAGGFGAIATFLLLTGFSTTMIRAAIVAGLSLLAWYFGRTVHGGVLLLIVAALTLFIDPSFLWGDVGWHLSFAAFAGVILLAPLIHHYFWGSREPGMIRYILVATISAQLTTFPIIAVAFEQYSPLAIIANVLIQPFVPLAMVLTLLAGLGGAIVPAAATIIAWPAYMVLSYMITVVNWLAASPLAYGEILFSATAVVVFYGAVLAAAIYLRRRTGHSFRSDNIVD